MPTLRQLLEELKKLHVDPDDIKVGGVIYDEYVEQAEALEDEAEEDE